jgi:hypothetical protein
VTIHLAHIHGRYLAWSWCSYIAGKEARRVLWSTGRGHLCGDVVVSGWVVPRLLRISERSDNRPA